jgi:hypothetical protein
MERTRVRAPALACAAALLSGCFTYIPTQLGSVPQGAQIRVHLSPATQVALSTQTNRRIEDILEGTLTGRQQDRLTLDVPIAAQQQGFFQSAIAQKVEVPEPGVVGIDVRRFSTSRTALLIGGGAAVTGGILTLLLHGGQGGGGSPPPVEEIRIPLVSFGVR